MQLLFKAVLYFHKQVFESQLLFRGKSGAHLFIALIHEFLVAFTYLKPERIESDIFSAGIAVCRRPRDKVGSFKVGKHTRYRRRSQPGLPFDVALAHLFALHPHDMNKHERMQLHSGDTVLGKVDIVLTNERPVNAANCTKKPLRFQNNYPAACLPQKIFRLLIVRNRNKLYVFILILSTKLNMLKCEINVKERPLCSENTAGIGNQSPLKLPVISSMPSLSTLLKIASSPSDCSSLLPESSDFLSSSESALSFLITSSMVT